MHGRNSSSSAVILPKTKSSSSSSTSSPSDAATRPKRRSSQTTSKEGKGSSSTVNNLDPLIKEGDIFYRTVISYPSIPIIPKQVILTTTTKRMELGLHTSGSDKSLSSMGNHHAMKERKKSSAEKDAKHGLTSSHEGGHESPPTTHAPMRTSEDIKERPSLLQLSANPHDSSKKRLISIWPEFSEADLSNEKWEVAHKGKDKTKTATAVQQVQHYFDDPEGRCELPPSLKVKSWKRPKDFLLDKIPVVVDLYEGINNFDLMSNNEVTHQSELMRWITSQISALWQQSEMKKTPEGTYFLPVPATPDPTNIQETMYTHLWRPWEHIYAMTKVGKGTTNFPLYNPCGKYVVKLYWMGCWRKLIVDDLMPFDEEDRLLLPSTSLSHELWPLLLTKALLKIAALDYTAGGTTCEFGDFNVIYSLKGWLPEVIPLQYGHMEEIWELLKTSLPEFRLPELLPSVTDEGKTGEQDQQKEQHSPTSNPTKSDKEREKSEKSETKAGRDVKGGKGTKASKKDKEKEKEEKERLKERLAAIEDQPLPDHPEMIAFVSYHGLPKQPARITMLTEMADASERLRQHGLSHSYPHPVLITETRSCPLEHPPLQENIPAWKLIRPKKKTTLPLAEPIENVPEKPIKSIHLMSPFFNHVVNAIDIPSNIHRPKSALERGSTQNSGQGMDAITENDDQNTSELQEKIKSIKTKETTKIVEEKQELQNEGKKSKKSRTDARKDQASPEGKTPPSSPKSDKRSARPSSKQSNKKSAAGADLGKNADSKDKGHESRLSTNAKDAKQRPSSGKQRPSSGKQRPSSGKQASPSVVDETTAAGAGEQAQDGDGSSDTQNQTPIAIELKTDLWMDFDVMCKCFKTLYIYHKPATYLCNYPDIKSLQTSASDKPEKSKSDKKSQASLAAAVPTSIDDKFHTNYLFVDSLKPTEIVVSFSAICHWNEPNPNLSLNDDFRATATPAVATSKAGKDKGDKDKGDRDKGDKTDRDKGDKEKGDKEKGDRDKGDKEKGDKVKGDKTDRDKEKGDREKVDKDKDKGNKSERSDRDSRGGEVTLPNESNSAYDGGQANATSIDSGPKEPLQPGLLVAEPYSWKSLVTGQPVLRLRTTSVRAAVLRLPEGRHVLRFTMTSPLGQHVHLCSTTNFIFGDEEKVMAELTKESYRFIESARKGMITLGRYLQNFSDVDRQQIARNEFLACNCLFGNKTKSSLSLKQHFEVFKEALYLILKDVFSSSEAVVTLATPAMSFAWRVFNFDCHFDSEKGNPLGIAVGIGPSRPTTAVTTSDRASSSSGTAKKSTNKKTSATAATQAIETVDAVASKLDCWKNKEITADEQIAAVKIQKVWKGCFVRKVKACQIPGTDENAKVGEQLIKAWTAIEPKIEQLGQKLFRKMFDFDRDLMKKYSFYNDEWNKISYMDYNGIFPEHGPNSWFLLFRDLFFVKEEILCVPKLTASTPTCMLRVINNDTGEEIPKVFLKVAPHVYKKNKDGYTFVAEARTPSNANLLTGRWRMRLIGSLTALPEPLKKEVNTSFNVQELKEYYVPTVKNIIFRYSVKVVDDHLATLQMSTSKPDVYFKLMILDSEEEVACAEGKGHTVLPAFIFRKDVFASYTRGDDEVSRSSSRSSTRLGAKSPIGGSVHRSTSQKRIPSATNVAAVGRSSVTYNFLVFFIHTHFKN